MSKKHLIIGILLISMGLCACSTDSHANDEPSYIAKKVYIYNDVEQDVNLALIYKDPAANVQSESRKFYRLRTGDYFYAENYASMPGRNALDMSDAVVIRFDDGRSVRFDKDSPDTALSLYNSESFDIRVEHGLDEFTQFEYDTDIWTYRIDDRLYDITE